MKKYKLGMYLGRFQPFHNGHKSIVDKMLEECENVVIVIGSSDKKGTIKNPFPVWERAKMITESCEGKVNVVYLPDRNTIANDSSWGDYVMENLAANGFFPDAIYQGYEVERNTWFTNYPSVTIVNVSRLEKPISATLIRAAMVEGKLEYIFENCPEAVYKHIKQSIFYGRDFHDEIR